MQHPMFTTKCADCGMPVAEGPLYTAEGDLFCETHLANHLTGNLVCDFCKGPDPVWRYEPKSDEMDVLIGDMAVVLDGAWAACDACCLAVEKHDVGHLIEVAVGNTIRNVPHEEDVRQVMMVYFTFVIDSLVRPPVMLQEGS